VAPDERNMTNLLVARNHTINTHARIRRSSTMVLVGAHGGPRRAAGGPTGTRPPHVGRVIGARQPGQPSRAEEGPRQGAARARRLAIETGWPPRAVPVTAGPFPLPATVTRVRGLPPQPGPGAARKRASAPPADAREPGPPPASARIGRRRPGRPFRGGKGPRRPRAPRRLARETGPLPSLGDPPASSIVPRFSASLASHNRRSRPFP